MTGFEEYKTKAEKLENENTLKGLFAKEILDIITGG